MGFKNLSLKYSYRTSDDDVINDFLVPSLNYSVMYKRAAGFFSSTALVKLSQGIAGLIKNNGKMQLVVSPDLSQEDIEAIKLGYEKKEDIINKRLLESIDEELTSTQKDRLNLMINLIEKGILNIKIAILNYGIDVGMYHEKIGIMEDNEGNKIAFTGSYNESLNSYVNNFESLDVYTNYSQDYNRVYQKEKDFDNLWNNSTEKLKVVDFPIAVKDKLFEKYYNRDNVKSEEQIIMEEKRHNEITPNMPNNFLRDYQNKAIDEWEKAKYNGVFDMATGTGKTLTALGACIRLFNNVEHLAIVIICPYTHLVEQWVEDLENYSFNPIVGYGSMKNKNWKEKLKNQVMRYNLGISKYLCFITTNATFKSDFVQEELKKIETNNVLFVADEAHNLGAQNLLSKLNNKFQYRLALSATFERYNDEEGTNKLFKYFGSKYCIHYSLKEAIKNGMLTEYYYYPIITYLSDDELDEYIFLTNKIRRCITFDKTGKSRLNDTGKALLLKRAKIVAGAMSKMTKVVSLLKKQNEEREITNTLIYCGATTINDVSFKEDENDEDDVKQIDYLRKLIKDNIDLKIAKFTSTETTEERKYIKEQFIDKSINAIIAIKCLDEGVNIPSIETAYLLASSTNPREYVQRRGRVLRKFSDKKYSIIYDFITLPRDLDIASRYSEEDLKGDLGLVKRELMRMEDFADDAINYSSYIEIRDKINKVYGTLLEKYNEEEFE